MPGDKSPAVHFGLLGPLRLEVDGRDVPIPSRRQRALLILLLLNAPRPVSTDRLIDQLWDGTPPPQAAVTLRSYVSSLRQTLSREGLESVLLTRHQGYSVDVQAGVIDAECMRALTEEGRARLRAGHHAAALECFDEALSLWGGDPLAEIADHESARGAITQITETYVGAAEGRFDALVALGRHLDAIPSLEVFVQDHPLREQPHALLMLALYRAGRASEGLEVFHRLSRRLRDQLGIDPSPGLTQLHQQMLQQDPILTAPQRADPSEPPSPHEPEHEDGAKTPRGGSRELVGRDSELAILTNRLSALTATGRGGLVLLGGEPGIGKSALLDALATQGHAQGVPVHKGRPPAASGAPPFWPWSQVVDSVAAALDDDELEAATSGRARLVRHLSPTLSDRGSADTTPTGDDPQALRFALYDAVSTFLRRATDKAPIVVTLDDIQWFDPASLELLSYVTPTLNEVPVLIVAAYRDLSADRSDALEATLATVSREDVVQEMAIHGLGRDDVAAIVALVTGQDDETSADLATVLHARTGGNPFFVRQLTRLMLERGVQPRQAADLQVPTGVRHVIADRLRALSTSATSLLEAAAILGRDFDLGLAASAAGLTDQDAWDALDEARAHGFVQSISGHAGYRRFVHALVQDVLRERLPDGRAMQLHAAVAAELARHGRASQSEVAEHMWAARELTGGAALDSQLRAADEASRVFANGQAEVYLRRALELTREFRSGDSLIELDIILRLFGIVAAERGWGDANLGPLIERAHELTRAAELDDSITRLWWHPCLFLLETGEESTYLAVLRTLEAALTAGADPGTSEGNPANLAALHLLTCFGRLASAPKPGAREALDRALDAARRATPAQLMAYEENLQVLLFVIDAYWASLTGDEQKYRAASSAAIAVADADGRPFPRAVARALSAACAPYLGRPELVLDLTPSALDLGIRFGFGWLSTLSHDVQIWAEAMNGSASVDEAIKILLAALSHVEASGRRGSRSSYLMWISDLTAQAGDRERARALLLQARNDPGPWQLLLVENADRRLEQLDRIEAISAVAPRAPHPS